MGQVIQGELRAKAHWKIGVVVARFNAEITERLERGAIDQLGQLGCAAQQIRLTRVPGAVEIPLAAKWLLADGCDAVLALGAVIRGETAHFDYVCASVERGCSSLQLEWGRPVAFGVLTTEDENQALARAGGKDGNKGAEAAAVAIEMLNLKDQILKPTPTLKEFNQ
jgi:6,7-dimethyl-8-ribityllumazine synthase